MPALEDVSAIRQGAERERAPWPRHMPLVSPQPRREVCDAQRSGSPRASYPGRIHVHRLAQGLIFRQGFNAPAQKAPLSSPE